MGRGLCVSVHDMGEEPLMLIIVEVTAEGVVPDHCLKLLSVSHLCRADEACHFHVAPGVRQVHCPRNVAGPVLPCRVQTSGNEVQAPCAHAVLQRQHPTWRGALRTVQLHT
jgi:hypothetical protein